MDDDTAPMKPCRFCGQEILAVASKCPHCESFQDWRRHLNLAVALGAALTGASTFWGLAWEPLRLAIRPDVAIETTFVAATSEAYFVLVRNSGNSPAVFRYAHAWFPANPPFQPNLDGNTFFDLSVSSEAVFIDSHASALLRLTIDDARQGDVDGNFAMYEMGGRLDCSVDISFAVGETEVFRRIDMIRSRDSDLRQCAYGYIDFVTGLTGVG